METIKSIYCAGALFSQSERDEMQAIAQSLEEAGFKVFLPHRDGLEFRNLLPGLVERGLPLVEAKEVISKAIFALDVYQVLDSDGLVFNLNGRVPDEGTMVEAGIAWRAGKVVVGYKDDPRSLMEGNDNPLVLGLTNFELVDSVVGVCDRFKELFAHGSTDTGKEHVSRAGLEVTLAVQRGDQNALCGTLVREFGRKPNVKEG